LNIHWILHWQPTGTHCRGRPRTTIPGWSATRLTCSVLTLLSSPSVRTWQLKQTNGMLGGSFSVPLTTQVELRSKVF
jgi:hypothetical protein